MRPVRDFYIKTGISNVIVGMFTGTAGAGSLILEFATLSRLTGDDRFEKAAYKAFFAIWNQKSDIGLVGNTINTWTGVCSQFSNSSVHISILFFPRQAWTSPEVTGIGAGIDSFYEYALKWYVLSGKSHSLSDSSPTSLCLYMNR